MNNSGCETLRFDSSFSPEAAREPYEGQPEPRGADGPDEEMSQSGNTKLLLHVFESQALGLRE
jgi:hypothetical protein